MAIARGLRGVAAELCLDPESRLWITAMAPFIAGVFNLGRAVAYRSLARAVNGELDPAGEGFPEKSVAVEVEPDGTVRWYYEDRRRWTPPV